MHIPRSSDGIAVVISDETTDITADTGTPKVTMQMPYGFSLKQVKAGLSTYGSTGSTFNIKVNDATIFSVKPTIDATETSTDTAATPSVLTSTPFLIAAGDTIKIFIDVAGSGAKGAKLYFIEGML